MPIGNTKIHTQINVP